MCYSFSISSSLFSWSSRVTLLSCTFFIVFTNTTPTAASYYIVLQLCVMIFMVIYEFMSNNYNKCDNNDSGVCYFFYFPLHTSILLYDLTLTDKVIPTIKTNTTRYLRLTLTLLFLGIKRSFIAEYTTWDKGLKTNYNFQTRLAMCFL